MDVAFLTLRRTTLPEAEIEIRNKKKTAALNFYSEAINSYSKFINNKEITDENITLHKKSM